MVAEQNKTNTSSGKIFPPNKSKKNLWLFTIAFGIVLAIGLLLLMAAAGDGSFLVPGIFMTLLGSVFFIARISFTNVSYYIDEKGIVLQRGKNKIEIPYSDIKSVTELKEQDAEEFIKKLTNESRLKEKDMAADALGEFSLTKMKAAFNKQRETYKHFSFLSVALVYHGSKRRIEYDKVNLPCDCVLILLQNGEGYFVSPANTKGFVVETAKNLKV